MMKFKFNSCNIFLSIALLYNTQGFFFSAGSIISRMLLLLLLLLSFYYFIKVNISCISSKYIRGVNLLVGMLTLYGIVNIVTGVQIFFNGELIKNYTYLTNNYVGLLPIYALYYFAQKGYITENKIAHITIFFVITAVIAFINSYVSLKMSNITEYEHITNNAGFIIISLFPLVFFLRRKPLFQYILIGVILTLVVFSMKRGAILLGGILIIWFLYRSFLMFSKKEMVFLLLVAIILGYIGIVQINHFFENDAYAQFLVKRTLEGNLSGRDNLYMNAWEHFVNADFFTMLFGAGANMTYEILGNRAHNDWLELLTNQGILGVLVYVYYWKNVIQTWNSAKMNKLVYSAMGAFVLIYAPKTLFSMSYDAMEIYSSTVLCWCVTRVDLNRLI